MALDKYQVASICVLYIRIQFILFKPRQRRLTVQMLLTSSVLSATSKQYFELTSSVSSTTSKQCFEQPATSFLVCSLIFIEYYFKFLFNEKWSGTGSLPVFDQGWQRKIRAKPIKTPLKPCFSIAWIMQFEQVGSKRQEGGKAGEIKRW